MEPGIRILDKLAKGFGLALSELMILLDKERKRIKEGYVVKAAIRPGSHNLIVLCDIYHINRR